MVSGNLSSSAGVLRSGEVPTSCCRGGVGGEQCLFIPPIPNLSGDGLLTKLLAHGDQRVEGLLKIAERVDLELAEPCGGVPEQRHQVLMG